MSKLIFTIFIVLFAPIIASAQTPPPPVVTQNQQIAFDYMDADLSFFGITKFQRAVDSGGFFDLGIPTVRNDNNTTPGASTYVIDIPALVPGLHKIDIRACTINGCSERASITFTLVAFANPALNVRLVNKPIGQ